MILTRRLDARRGAERARIAVDVDATRARRDDEGRGARARANDDEARELIREIARMSRTLTFDDAVASTSTSSSDDEDVCAPVVIGGARGRRAWRARRVRAPEASDDDEDDDEDARAKARAKADGDGSSDDGSVDTVANAIGSRTIIAVGRARQDAFERARARRERARATAAKRIASLELELAVAREMETRELAMNLETVKSIGARLRAADEALFDDARRAREARAAAAQLAREETDALVMRAVAADAEAKEAAERARVEEEKRRQEAEEAARKKAEEDAEAAKKRAEEEAKEKAREEEAKRKQAASDYVSGKATGEIPRVAAAAEALEQETNLAKTLVEARAMVAEYQSHPTAKLERRKLTNTIVVHVQQIAATKEQINKKSRDIMMLLVQLQEPQKTFALMSIAKKMLSQCDVQVAKLNRYAFALAEVAVSIAIDVPRFGVLLVALIHEVCVNAVPKYYPFVPGRYATDDEYYSLMGYVKNDEGTAFETTDSYVDRMTGIMLFYAAFLQVDAPNHPHGVDAAWRWLARLLNRCPPNRHTAVALDSFLKIAGFRMYAAYRGQFVKVLELIHREFLPKLDAKNDPDIRPVSSRIATYLQESLYTKSPEGRDMPNTDTSSHTF